MSGAAPAPGGATGASRYRLWLVLLLSIVGVFHAVKLLGHFPALFPDEQVYSFDIRLRELPDVEIQNYLYYSLYKAAKLFGGRFLDAARVMNALAFMLSAPFIYLISRLACGRRLSLFVTVASLLAPVSVYTQLLMPESLYYTAFWLALWLFMKFRGAPAVRFAAAAGAVVALLSMIKYHGAFLLAGAALYIALSAPGERLSARFRSAARSVAALLLSFAAAKLAVGYLLAGSGAFALFGRHYGALSASGLASLSPSLFLTEFLRSLFGQAQALALILGLPLLLAVDSAAGRLVSPDAGALKTARRLSTLFLSCLVPLVAATAVFAAIATGAYAHLGYLESKRIHLRYYSFLFPAALLLAGYVHAIGPGRADRRFSGNWHYLVPFALSAYAVATFFGGRDLYVIPDCPELAFASDLMFRIPFYAIALLGVVALFLWRARFSLAGGFWLFAFLPLFVFYTFAANNYLVAKKPPDADSAMSVGFFLSEHLGGEIADLAIVDGSGSTGSRMLYAIDADLAYYRYLGRDADALLEEAARGKKWLAVINIADAPDYSGDFVIDFPLLATRIVRVADFDYSVDFSDPDPPWPVDMVYASGDAIAVEYKAQLPEKVLVRIDRVGAPAAPAGAGYEIVLGRREPLAVEPGRDYVVTLDRRDRDRIATIRQTGAPPDGAPAGSEPFYAAPLRLTLRRADGDRGPGAR